MWIAHFHPLIPPNHCTLLHIKRVWVFCADASEGFYLQALKSLSSKRTALVHWSRVFLSSASHLFYSWPCFMLQCRRLTNTQRESDIYMYRMRGRDGERERHTQRVKWYDHFPVRSARKQLAGSNTHWRARVWHNDVWYSNWFLIVL